MRDYYYPYENMINEFIANILPINNNNNIIDLGCGNSCLWSRLQNKCKYYFRVDVESKYFLKKKPKKVVDINEDITILKEYTFPRLNVVIMSLSAMYNPKEKVDEIWSVIDSITNKDALVICVDLHPWSVDQVYEWKKPITGLKNHDNNEMFRSVLVNRKLRFSYYHHTFNSLYLPPIKRGYHLSRISVLPQNIIKYAHSIEPYILTLWTR
ncbi:MAG: hypothetical protein MJA29_01005 [Candidatus Omnitrophica bacterium]|nr:hypothetical protein [Candidatus Omnitrophota bacterium]